MRRTPKKLAKKNQKKMQAGKKKAIQPEFRFQPLIALIFADAKDLERPHPHKNNRQAGLQQSLD